MSKKVLYMAMDVHARYTVFGTMDSNGVYQNETRFPTCESQIIGHLTAIKNRKKILAIEETSLAQWICQIVHPYVDELVIADPRENDLISRNAKKSDHTDTYCLCRLLRLNELKKVYHPTENHRAIFKESVQHYLNLTMEEVRLKQKIKAKYRRWGVAVDSLSVYDSKHKEIWLNEVKDMTVRNQLKRLYLLLELSLEQQETALKEAKRLSQRYPEIKEFRKIPGVGWVGALVFDAFIQTPHRFHRRNQLFRYSRLGVTDRTSDGKPLGYSRLDRSGNSPLKRMSYVAWMTTQKSDNEVRRLFMRCLERTKNRVHARLTTQRKILNVMWSLWRRNESYNPECFCTGDNMKPDLQ